MFRMKARIWWPRVPISATDEEAGACLVRCRCPAPFHEMCDAHRANSAVRTIKELLIVVELGIS
jgi:hypothetical protein